MFAVAENDAAKILGHRGAWHETHNTYTQISSEAGIPALFLYVTILVVSWKSLTRMQAMNIPGRHPREAELNVAARGLKIYLSVMFFGGMFTSFAYLPFMPTLIGLIYALTTSAEQEFRRLNSPVPMQAPSRRFGRL
jgi:O-antigen ligase